MTEHRRRARPGKPGVDRPRRAAYDLLHEVGSGDAYANLALPAILSAHDLHGRDAAFTTELAFTTLRWRGLLDAVLARCVDRPLDRLDPQVLDLLRLGATQLLLMRVPTHAAVSETVALTRDVRGEGASKLVNAVLRKVAARDLTAWREVVTVDVTDESERLAIFWSHPRWIVSALREAMSGEGVDPDQIEQLLEVDNEAPGVTLVARPGRCSVDELLELESATPGLWSPYAVYLGHGSPGEISAVRQRRAAVQDEGSQLIAIALADAPLVGRDEQWLDLCAGPGGKAALLGALAAKRGAAVLAIEPVPHRAELVRSTTFALPVEVREIDGRSGDLPESEFDRVLVDAPCTGLGVVRRRPEARWRRQPSDVATLAVLQRELLTAGLRAVRPGGVVLYSTCSPHLAETEFVVDDVVQRAGGAVERVAISLVPGEAASENARLWPHRHGTDGMYAALLRRMV
ncbi:MAG: hypothetical protein NTZ03_11420 [Actinobacteria bacterium]|nr:hypothetical protein [Actinomycetota bacterium]